MKWIEAISEVKMGKQLYTEKKKPKIGTFYAPLRPIIFRDKRFERICERNNRRFIVKK